MEQALREERREETVEVSAASLDGVTGPVEKGRTHTEHGLEKAPGHRGRWGWRENVSR